MLREPLGKYKVAVCEYDTNYIEGKWKRKIPLMFYYPSDSGNKMCPYKDATYQIEKSKGNETDNGVKTYCYTDGTLLSEKEKYPVVIYSHGLKGFQMESTVLCNPLNYKAHSKLKKIGYPQLKIKRFRHNHWEFSDGIYFSDRGKKNRNWSNEVSEKRANLCLEFLSLC